MNMDMNISIKMETANNSPNRYEYNSGLASGDLARGPVGMALPKKAFLGTLKPERGAKIITI